MAPHPFFVADRISTALASARAGNSAERSGPIDVSNFEIRAQRFKRGGRKLFSDENNWLWQWLT